MSESIVREIIKMNPFLEKPIFAFGSGRCGSTLLRTLVDGHTQVLCWPFEFSFYSIFEAAIDSIQTPVRLWDLFLFFYKEGAFQHIGTDYDGDLGHRRYLTNTIQSNIFYNLMRDHANEQVSRKEFFQFIIYSYYQSMNIQNKPDQWFVTLTIPSSEPLEDFPDCKAVVLTRNPLDTYVSVKRFYFKGAELSGRDKCSVYRPGAANRKVRWGLLETAVYPIISTFQWLDKNRGDPRVMQLFLEKLRENPEESMRSFSIFCTVNYCDSLLKPTFLGQPHYSNLSSGKSSGSIILPQKERMNYLKELTVFEYSWASKLFFGINRKNGYKNPGNILDTCGLNHLLGFFKPLKNEFPALGNDNRWNKRKWVRFCVRTARWCLAPLGYIANRIVMLLYCEEKNRVSVQR